MQSPSAKCTAEGVRKLFHFRVRPLSGIPHVLDGRNNKVTPLSLNPYETVIIECNAFLSPECFFQQRRPTDDHLSPPRPPVPTNKRLIGVFNHDTAVPEPAPLAGPCAGRKTEPADVSAPRWFSKYLIVSRNVGLHLIQFHLRPIRRSRCASFFSQASVDNVICVPELRRKEKTFGCPEWPDIIASESVAASSVSF